MSRKSKGGDGQTNNIKVEENKEKNQSAAESEKKAQQCTTIAQSAQDLGAPDHDDVAWIFAGTKADNFYAAAFLFECTDSERSWKQGKVLDHEESMSVRGLFLDQIALLFARAKTIVGDSYKTDRCPSTAPKNVTATAWGGHYMKNQQQYVPIYIAKNNGPQVFDDRNDVEFAAELESWYNKLSPDAEPENMFQDPMWASMRGFWFRRHRFYIDEIRKIHRSWTSKHKINLGTDRPNASFVDRLKELNESKDIQTFQPAFNIAELRRFEEERLKAFEKDWAHVGVLLRLLSEHGDSIQEDSVLNKYVNQICSDQDTWRKPYQKPYLKKREEYKLQDSFRKVIKYLKMLKTLSLVWNACISLKRQAPAVKISFRFLLRQEMTSIPPEPLQNLLESWKEAKQKKPSEEPIRSISTKRLGKRAQGSMKDRLDYTRDKLGYLPSLPRDFHCELQLLLVPYGVNYLAAAEHEKSASGGDQTFKYQTTKNEAMFNYIGCSKLSCYSCWKALKLVGCSTKNTHSRLHSRCAFPIHALPQFSKSSGENSLRRMTNKLQKNILGKESSATYVQDDYMTQTATAPTELLSQNASVPARSEPHNLFAWEPKITLGIGAAVSNEVRGGGSDESPGAGGEGEGAGGGSS